MIFFLLKRAIHTSYRKVPKLSGARNFAVSHLNFKQRGQSLGYFIKNDANRIANSADPDQTVPLGAVWSALFAQSYLSENLRSLQ